MGRGFDGRVEGAALTPVLPILERRLSPRPVDELLARLDPTFATIWRTGPVASEWYPEEMLVDMLAASLELLGPDAMAEIGYEQQKITIKRMHTFIARIAGPARLLQLAAKTWSMCRDTGAIIRREPPHTTHLEFRWDPK
jgi:hypothetical protein